MTDPDIIVIGAGPAGMAAATLIAERGGRVLLLDEQRQAGGQIYRDVELAGVARGGLLGKDYLHGLELTRGLASAGVEHVCGAQVWMVKPDGLVAWSRDGRGHLAKAKRIIIATGALERPTPIPGWTMPGVMTAGAAQIMLKQSGLVPRRAVLAGSGPLLYLLAQQMIRAGVPPLALVETQTRSDLIAALPDLPGALRGWRYLVKGAALLADIRKAGVRRYTGATDLRVEGEPAAEAISFSHRGRPVRIACDTVLLHQGVVPNVQISRSLGLTHRWRADQACFSPVTDAWARSSVETICIAGDGAGIGGALAAEHAGRLAALGALEAEGFLAKAERDRLARPIRRQLDRELAARPFIDRAYPPSRETRAPDDDTIICRCEEVTAGDIRAYARLGCKGPNQAKAFGRAGMGPCQGRYCGLTVTAILSEANGQTCEETGYFRIRQPLKPITLGELASIQDNPDLEFEE